MSEAGQTEQQAQQDDLEGQKLEDSQKQARTNDETKEKPTPPAKRRKFAYVKRHLKEQPSDEVEMQLAQLGAGSEPLSDPTIQDDAESQQNPMSQD